MPYPVVWKPSPNLYVGRSTYQPIAIVNHRMAGFLAGTDATFLNPDNQVSAHFGIGVNKSTGAVEVHQYVDLSDSAWANGNYDPSGGWTLVKKTGTGTIINPNYYTVSIEHEDGGTTGRGVVTPAIRDASTWLSSVLLTGSAELLRSYGIRVRLDETAVALGQITIGDETYIDHNRISGTKKPYCWRAWLDDPGFVPKYKPEMMASVKEMNMTIEEVMALLQQKIDGLEADRDAAIAEKNAALVAKTQAETKLAAAKSKAAEIEAL